jgi:glycosyltransferase involved in cell wall biosynthesis
MIIVHLTASTFFGGPERQMLGLAKALPADYRSVFLSYSEGGRSEAFLDEASRQGFEAHALRYDTPHFRRMIRELSDVVTELGGGVLICHTYKPNLIGRLAARRAGIPVVAVSRGWTAESWRVRVYEALDRLNLRWVDRVVCVSEGQAEKVRRAGVAPNNVTVIRNAIDPTRFTAIDLAARDEMGCWFSVPVGKVVGAAGRLSPEKGFDMFIEAADLVRRQDASVGFVLFGEGALRERLQQQVQASGLTERFVFAGFRHDLDRFLPNLDLFVQSSYTEGLPNVLLEARAAGVPVVATAVGGTTEVIEPGPKTRLVPSASPMSLAEGILNLINSPRRAIESEDTARIPDEFTFESQAERYEACLAELLPSPPSPVFPVVQSAAR